jgi:hypothetical protein
MGTVKGPGLPSRQPSRRRALRIILRQAAIWRRAHADLKLTRAQSVACVLGWNADEHQPVDAIAYTAWGEYNAATRAGNYDDLSDQPLPATALEDDELETALSQALARHTRRRQPVRMTRHEQSLLEEWTRREALKGWTAHQDDQAKRRVGGQRRAVARRQEAATLLNRLEQKKAHSQARAGAPVSDRAAMRRILQADGQAATNHEIEAALRRTRRARHKKVRTLAP